ncbi:MAG: hypothetical protein HDR28_04080 [Lachnospiraceae bacterium]|nr:hypothetical protein [Lachnospiraceae bacterium]
MNEKIFGEAYRNAYNSILPGEDSVEKILARVVEENRKQQWGVKRTDRKRKRGSVQEAGWGQNQWRAGAIRHVIVTLLFVCILSAVSLPVLAAHVPAVYRMLERYVPDMADYIVPEEPECADQGIIMRVEGIQLEGNHAEIVVSFANQEGFHHIKGKVDMYDSYGLVSYKGVGTVGGCFFLTYDEAEEKAYFRIDMTADQDFDREKLSFHVGELLTTMGREEKDVDLSEILYDAPMKEVELRGGSYIFAREGQAREEEIQSAYAVEDPRNHEWVLDGMPAAECAADDFTLTGIAYMNGVLRVQMCMGDNTHADRHVQLFLTDTEGNERHEDGNVSWFEDVEETHYTFYEYGFLIEEKELENVDMYGIFHNAEESVKGDWKVTFRLE